MNQLPCVNLHAYRNHIIIISYLLPLISSLLTDLKRPLHSPHPNIRNNSSHIRQVKKMSFLFRKALAFFVFFLYNNIVFSLNVRLFYWSI